VRYVTTALEIVGVLLIAASVVVAFGLAGALAAAGLACVGTSYVLSRGSA
jgi:hypothetical protein